MTPDVAATEMARPVQPGTRGSSPFTWKSALRAAGKAARIPTAALRPLPEFLVIGAQRAGTTSLFKYLAQHPSFAPAVMRTKGVHFFDTDYDRGLRWYRSHFPSTPARWRAGVRAGSPVVTGEASPYYLFHPQAPGRIATTMPEAKLIAMLRDPIERALSGYQHERSRQFESAESFEEALDLEPGRLAGVEARMASDPGYRSFSHQHHSYLARGRYAEQLERYLALFPREQVHVIIAEDFFADPAGNYAEVVAFLGLSAHRPSSYEKHNAHSYSRMAPSTRARLADHFAEPNAHLARLLGRDPGWSG